MIVLLSFAQWLFYFRKKALSYQLLALLVCLSVSLSPQACLDLVFNNVYFGRPPASCPGPAHMAQ